MEQKDIHLLLKKKKVSKTKKAHVSEELWTHRLREPLTTLFHALRFPITTYKIQGSGQIRATGVY